MTSLSEADYEIRLVVVSILGECTCDDLVRAKGTRHENDPHSPRCAYHRYGDAVADLARMCRKHAHHCEELQVMTGARVAQPVHDGVMWSSRIEPFPRLIKQKEE